MDVEELLKVVRASFEVRDFILTESGINFDLEPESEEIIKKKFADLAKKLVPRGIIPKLLRGENSRPLLLLRNIPEASSRSRRSSRRQMILLMITMFTVAASGYLLSLGTASLLARIGVKMDVVQGAILYVLGLMSILGIHESGHIISNIKWGGEVELPYFIPFIPPYGTLGALITSGKIPINRDELFDLGISGPVAGFIVAVVVSFAGVLTSHVVPSAIAAQWERSGEVAALPMPVLVHIYEYILGVTPREMLLLSPLAIAGIIGLIVTFLNLLPASQLDGGHVAYSLLADAKKRTVVGWLAALLTIPVSPMMALIIVFLMMMFPHPPPLDEYTGVSKHRKVLGSILYSTLMVLCFPLPS